MSTNNGIRLLVVDDDAMVRRSLCEVLSFEGHSCVTVGSGAEALARLGEGPVDIVISDMKMPQMGGAGAAAASQEGPSADRGHHHDRVRVDRERGPGHAGRGHRLHHQADH